MSAALRLIVVVLGLTGLLGGSMSGAAAQPREFVFLQTAEAGSLNHLWDWTVAGLAIHAHLYEPLVDMEGPGFKTVPKLAVQWETVNPRTWRFKLRPGVKFHNGQELTSEDVRFTFEAAGGPRSVKRSLVALIEKVETPDKSTVLVTTKQPDAAFLARLGFLYIVNKAAYERDPEEYGRKPVGTGPFRVASWAKDQQLVLEAFPEYWGSKPSVTRLIVKPVKEATARLAELQTGRANVIRSVPVEMAKDLAKDQSVQLIDAHGVRQIYYTFNTTKAPLSDVRVRQAINYAVDRDSIVKNVLEGYGEVRGGPFSPKQWGADPAAKGYTYDPERARTLLREAGYPNGIDLTWDITRGTVVKDAEIGEAVANMLRQVGIRARLNTLEAANLVQRQNAGQFEMSQISWSLQADPDSVISGLRIHSSVGNAFKSEAIDKLIDQSRTTLDPAKRLAIYHQLHRALIEAAPWLVIHAQDELFAARKGVEWTPYPFGGNAGMTYFFPMR